MLLSKTADLEWQTKKHNCTSLEGVLDFCLGLSSSFPDLIKEARITVKFSWNSLVPQLYRPSYHAKAELNTDDEPDLATH